MRLWAVMPAVKVLVRLLPIYRPVPHGPIAGATEWLLIGAAAQRQPVWELSRTSIEVFH